MRGATAKKLRALVYGEDFSRRNEGKYRWGTSGGNFVAAGKRGEYRQAKRDFNKGRLVVSR